MTVRSSRRGVPERCLPPLGLVAAALAAYVLTLASGLVKGDGGEFQLAMATLGVPHATGYPLYTLVGWLWIKAVPLGSVAWRVHLFSAVCGALAAVLVYAIVRRLTRRTLPALAAGCFLAFSPTFWVLSSVAEVYTLNTLFAASLIYFLLVWSDSGHRYGHLLGAAFLFGLGLSHHRTIVLLAPAMGLFLLLEGWPRTKAQGGESGDHRPEGARGRAQGAAVRGLQLGGAFVAGLLPYIHVLVHETRQGIAAREVVTQTILGGQYRFSLGLRSDPAQVLFGWPRQEMGVAGLILAVAGLAWLLRRRFRMGVLLASGYVCLMAFFLLYRVSDLPDFMLPATMILGICAGASAGWLELVAGRAPPGSGRGVGRMAQGAWLRWVLEGALLLWALSSLHNIGAVRASVQERTGDVEERARALLAYPFEPGATVVADWELTTAARYLAQVEKLPTNGRFLPVRLITPDGCASLLATLDAGQAVYAVPPVVISRMPDGYTMRPAQSLARIVKEASPYQPVGLPVTPQLGLQGVQRDGSQLVLRWLVTGPALEADYTTYVHYFDSAGNAIGQQDKGMGAEATCWYPSTAWPVGRVVQDLFAMPPETAGIRVGLYGWNGDQIQPYGEPLVITLAP